VNTKDRMQIKFQVESLMSLYLQISNKGYGTGGGFVYGGRELSGFTLKLWQDIIFDQIGFLYNLDAENEAEGFHIENRKSKNNQRRIVFTTLLERLMDAYITTENADALFDYNALAGDDEEIGDARWFSLE
jgi:hypothetical protein